MLIIDKNVTTQN